MVNLDKWEKVEFKDLKNGDKIKRVTKNPDGTKAVVTGVLDHRGVTGDWLSRDKFRLADENYCTKLYRRKPKRFEFPTNHYAVIECTPRWGGKGVRRFVRLPLGWTSPDRAQAFEDALLANFTDHKVIQAGIE